MVAEQAGQIVAFASFSPAHDDDVDGAVTAEVLTLYALEHVWGQGVGAALWAAAVPLLQAQGFSELILWVLKGNSRAIRFYERMGLRFDNTTKTERWGDGLEIQELRYRMTLSKVP